MAMVRLADVAQAAGVSMATASVAVNHTNPKTIRVTAETAHRIQKIAKAMGYVPNISAKRLAGKSAKVIGVIMDSHAVPSAYEVLQAITQEALASGYQVMVSEVHDSIRKVERAHQELLCYGVDGVICLASDYPGQREEFLRNFADSDYFIVLNPVAGSPLTGPVIDVSVALGDALRHLTAQGYQRLGFVIPDVSVWDIEQRLVCIAQWCEANRAPLPKNFEVEFSLDRSRIAGQMQDCVRSFILAEKLDVVMVFNDLYGAYLNRAIRADGLSVPEDIAVVGWDNSTFSETLTPPLSSVDSHTRAQGVTAVKLLMKQLKGEEILAEDTLIRSQFIPRASSVKNHNDVECQ